MLSSHFLFGFGATPGSTLRNHSWRCWGTISGARDPTWVCCGRQAPNQLYYSSGPPTFCVLGSHLAVLGTQRLLLAVLRDHSGSPGAHNGSGMSEDSARPLCYLSSPLVLLLMTLTDFFPPFPLPSNYLTSFKRLPSLALSSVRVPEKLTTPPARDPPIRALPSPLSTLQLEGLAQQQPIRNPKIQLNSILAKVLGALNLHNPWSFWTRTSTRRFLGILYPEGQTMWLW